MSTNLRHAQEMAVASVLLKLRGKLYATPLDAYGPAFVDVLTDFRDVVVSHIEDLLNSDGSPKDHTNQLRSSKVDIEDLRDKIGKIEAICWVTNNNQPGWDNVVETRPGVTMSLGTRLYVQSDVLKMFEALAQTTLRIEDLESQLAERGPPLVVDFEDPDRLVLENGKYTFYTTESTLLCDRYDTPWRSFVRTGDYHVFALYDALREVKAQIESSERQLAERDRKLSVLVGELEAQKVKLSLSKTEFVEGAWLIQRLRPSGIEYRFMMEGEGLQWTTDPLQAIRFARRVDAQKFAAEDSAGAGESWLVVEHPYPLESPKKPLEDTQPQGVMAALLAGWSAHDPCIHWEAEEPWAVLYGHLRNYTQSNFKLEPQLILWLKWAAGRERARIRDTIKQTLGM